MGPPGPQGDAGQSVVGVSIGPTAQCPFGGVRYESASGVDFVCHGAPGVAGPPGLVLVQLQDGGTSILDGGVVLVSGPPGRDAPPPLLATDGGLLGDGSPAAPLAVAGNRGRLLRYTSTQQARVLSFTWCGTCQSGAWCQGQPIGELVLDEVVFDLSTPTLFVLEGQARLDVSGCPLSNSHPSYASGYVGFEVTHADGGTCAATTITRTSVMGVGSTPSFPASTVGRHLYRCPSGPVRYRVLGTGECRNACFSHQLSLSGAAEVAVEAFDLPAP
jgi:hypothetical protein